MNNQLSPRQKLFQIFDVLNKHRMHIIVPTIVGMILAAVYAVALRDETWSARQTLEVRDDLHGQSFKPGRFESLESMKSAQESIFEIARKPQVIRNALKQLGPPSSGFFGLGNNGYPSDEVIESVQGAVSLSAPNGAEFGSTESIILNTNGSTRERAGKFTGLLVQEIISKVNEVRSTRFQSMASELELTCKAAEQSLEDSKQRLREMDLELGQDAAGMSAIGESSFRDDPITREIAQLNLERRKVKSDVESAQNVRTGLIAAKRNPEAIVNISSELAVRQPELNLLKQELVKLKGSLASLRGKYEPIHPKVEDAYDAIIHMQNQIRMQLDNAIKDIENQVDIHEGRLSRLDDSIGELKQRLVTLGKHRADGVTLIADVKKRTDILNNARSELAEIQGLTNSKDARLLTKVGEAQVSTRPDGLGKKALVLAGGLGGMLLGLGWVMLIAPPIEQEQSFVSSSGVSPQNGFNGGSSQPVNLPAPEPAKPAPVPSQLGATSLAVGAAGQTTNVLRDLVGVSKEQPSSEASRGSGSGIGKIEESAPLMNTGKETQLDEEIVAPPAVKSDQQSLATPNSPTPAPVSLRKKKPTTPMRKLAQTVPAVAIPTKINTQESNIEKIVAESFEKTDEVKESAEEVFPAKTFPKTLEIEIPRVDSSLSATQPEAPAKPSGQRGFKIGRKSPVSSATPLAAASDATSSRANELADLVKELKGSTDEVANQQDRLEQSLSSLESFVDQKVTPAMDKAFQDEFKTGQETGVSGAQAKESEQIAALQRALGSTKTPATVRPVDLAKSTETQSPEGSKTVPKERSVNPFLIGSGSALKDDTDDTGSVPDQIKKLSESIANFSKPFQKKNGKGKF